MEEMEMMVTKNQGDGNVMWISDVHLYGIFNN